MGADLNGVAVTVAPKESSMDVLARWEKVLLAI